MWSEMDEMIGPVFLFLGLFEKKLSIKVPLVSVIRLGSKMAGRNDADIREFKKSFVIA